MTDENKPASDPEKIFTNEVGYLAADAKGLKVTILVPNLADEQVIHQADQLIDHAVAYLSKPDWAHTEKKAQRNIALDLHAVTQANLDTEYFIVRSYNKIKNTGQALLIQGANAELVQSLASSALVRHLNLNLFGDPQREITRTPDSTIILPGDPNFTFPEKQTMRLR